MNTPTTPSGKAFRTFLAQLMAEMAPEEPNEYDERFDAGIVAIERGAVSAAQQEIERLRAAIRTVLDDAESQHPGGWGPDVTMVAVLRAALESAPTPTQEEKQ